MDKDFLAFMVVAGMVIGGITLGTTIYNVSANEKIAEMVAGGASPAEAACAINNESRACIVANGQETK